MLVHIVEGIDGASEAEGTVVVIDVVRAFTKAAYAFDAGLSEIELVSTIEEALAAPGFRMGEVGGRLIPGFDHNNSSSQLLGKRLAGRAVFRTGAGTRCVAAATKATEIWLGSLVVASATVRALAGREEITLVASGLPGEREEDLACAEWIAASLQNLDRSDQAVVATVEASRAAAKHRQGDPDFPPEDVRCATAIDAFRFAMRAERHGGRVLARPLFV